MRGVLRVDEGEARLDPETEQVFRDVAQANDLEFQRGPIVFCAECGYHPCVCAVIAGHAPACRYRIASTYPIGLRCEHGYDVCPECDACSCGAAP